MRPWATSTKVKADRLLARLLTVVYIVLAIFDVKKKKTPTKQIQKKNPTKQIEKVFSLFPWEMKSHCADGYAAAYKLHSNNLEP